MTAKPAIILLSALLLISVGVIIYLVVKNPVRGYSLAYDNGNYKLFVKDTVLKTGKSLAFSGGGRRIDHATGIAMIKRYRKEIITHEDSVKMTRFVDFNFDNVFSYLGYILSVKGDVINPTDQLGFRVYVGTRLTPSRVGGQDVYSHTMIFAPIKDHDFYKFVFDSDFDFLDQGSICPENCPADEAAPLN
jgi:hypothetical protein